MDAARVLAVNAGSSSIRFALYEMGKSLHRRARGKIDRIGVSGTTLTVEGLIGAGAQSYAIDVRNHDGAASALSDWLEDAGLFSAVKAVGHRVVHGMKHSVAETWIPAWLTTLRAPGT